MADQKLTEAEIMKAAECCKNKDCVACHLSSNRYESKCKTILFEAVIDFMNVKNKIITEAKMTEAEIMKALEICTTKGASCKNCPAFVKVDRSRCKEVFKGAIDLINHKNEVIKSFTEDRIILRRN
jgi:hypothetical protein